MPMPSAALPDIVVVGRVTRPHGLRGEVVVEPESDVEERFEPGSTMRLGRGGRRVEVADSRPFGDRLLVRFAGFEDRTAVEGIRGVELTIEDWQKLTRGLDVKYVLVGEIESFTLTNPQRIGLLDPTIVASYRLFNVETGKLAMERPNFTVELEKSQAHEIPTLELGTDVAETERRLLAMLATEIGQDLYGYYRE